MTPSDYLRALLDSALVAEAGNAMGVLSNDEAALLAHAKTIVHGAMSAGDTCA